MVQTELHGTMADGRKARKFTLRNVHGLTAIVSEMGASLVSFEAPDRNGNWADLTLGYQEFDDWCRNPAYLGATVGRFGNRIKAGQFTIDHQFYQLATNNQPGDIPCHLHGGVHGFDKMLWDGEVCGDSVTFRRRSIDGEEGYPGNLEVAITYTLNDDNELIWEAQASTDAPTIVNLVHHTYWNLTGDPRRDILDHVLRLEADHFLPTDDGLIPTGEKKSVTDTPMDFTQSMRIGERIHVDYLPLHQAGGYDHCWVLRNDDKFRLAAEVFEPTSGRRMQVFTDQPAIQFYAGNFLDGSITGKNGIAYDHRCGFCLETENFPDAPNHVDFPNSILRPGEVYRHCMVHRFSC